jgi:hypothetical protein
MDLTVDELPEDARFEIAKRMNYESINKLCRTNRLFNDFCGRFEGDIYKYLLLRDFGIDYPRDGAKARYFEYLNGPERLFKILRDNGSTEFADMIELRMLSTDKPEDILLSNVFTSDTRYLFLIPSDAVMQEKSRQWEMSSYEIYNNYGLELILSHIGTFDSSSNTFTNLASHTFDVIPKVSIGGIQFRQPVFVGTRINIYVIDHLLITEDQEFVFNDMAWNVYNDNW